jgi:predicted nucleic acid-binding protein
LSQSTRFLVDTSAWIETLRTGGEPAIRSRVSAMTAEDRVLLCDQVRLELWSGATNARHQRLLRDLEAQLETVPTTPQVWALACELARSSRAKGLTVPAADLLIAACAKHHGLGLIHCDEHFDLLERLGGGV